MISRPPQQVRPTLAVVGATGAVGSVMLRVLSHRADVWGEIRLVASSTSVGRTLTVCGREVVVQGLTEDVFDGVDVALFHVPEDVAAQWAPIAVDRGAVVVDSSSAFRAAPDVPLVAAAVNPAQVRNRPRGIIANPACATLTMIDALGALHSGWELTELVVSTYHAASSVGQAGIERLHDELEAVAGQRGLGQQASDIRAALSDRLDEESPFVAPLALNVVPWIGWPAEDGWTSEELSLRHEARRVLGLPDLKVSATCVRVPVVTGHSMAVHATFARPIKVADARQALVEAPSVVVLDEPDQREFPTPADIVGSDPTFVGRMRQSLDFPHTIELFICGDNLRKGAALNTVQVAELVARDLAAVR